MKVKKQIESDWDVIRNSAKLIFISALFASIYYFLVAPWLEVGLFYVFPNRWDVAGFIYQFISYSLYSFLIAFVSYKIISLEIKEKRRNNSGSKDRRSINGAKK